MTFAQSRPKYRDGRRHNGGVRAGAGRPVSKHRKIIEEHLLQEVVVKEFRHGQIRQVKKKLLKAILDELFRKGMDNNATPNERVRALRAYLDVTVGRPRKERSKTKQRFRESVYTKHFGLPNYARPPKF